MEKAQTQTFASAIRNAGPGQPAVRYKSGMTGHSKGGVGGGASVGAPLRDRRAHLDRLEGPSYRRILVPIDTGMGCVVVANLYGAAQRR